VKYGATKVNQGDLKDKFQYVEAEDEDAESDLYEEGMESDEDMQ
jgi:hypothetical protein